MALNSIQPTLTITKAQARRFLTAYHGLRPSRTLEGKDGVLSYIDRVGCIQYDPIDIVGNNPHLVLQARVKDYRRSMLDELLYQERKLWDGLDKVMAIYRIEDWPYFARQRANSLRRLAGPEQPSMAVAPKVREALRTEGPLSSIDLEHEGNITWWWGRPTRLIRTTMEVLFFTGELGIHHRVATRRVFDLAERLIPPEIYQKPDPNLDEESYHEWHVLRRVGGMGLASSNATEAWLGIQGMKARERQQALARLMEEGLVAAVSVDGLAKRIYFVRTQDLPRLEQAGETVETFNQVTFLGPLDNMLWDRELLREIFGFDYIWEVYKPAALRKYGHYVLPMLFGDRFAGRMEPTYDKKKRILTINHLWWEAGMEMDDRLRSALEEGLREFAGYLGAVVMKRGPEVEGFDWLDGLKL